MAWEFQTEPDYQRLLEWADAFVSEAVEPLDYVVAQPWDLADPVRRELIPPLQAMVREKGLWATHLGPELGGPGYGQVKLGLLNEILGRSACAPIVFGCQAPDSGNAEILAHYGTEEHKQRYLEPLLANDIVSCFSMTEPQGGADPGVFETRAVRDGDEWVITGEKWFSSHAQYAAFLIVMAVTDPRAPLPQRLSAFIVPAETAGVEIVREVGLYGEPEGHGSHPYVRYNDVRVPADGLLGPEGGGFTVAQVRLGGGRIHHAMRTVGATKRVFDMLCERAVSRRTKGEPLADKQLVQQMVADSWVEIEQFRLLVLHTAWKIDQGWGYKALRADISAVKVVMAKLLHDVTARALQVHGSLGVTNEMPFMRNLLDSFVLGLADGPSEVHKVTVARQVLRGYKPAEGLFPSAHGPTQMARARESYATVLGRYGR
jgi:acyl-CoA dehydrogenase